MAKCYSLLVFVALFVNCLSVVPLKVDTCGNIPADKLLAKVNSYGISPNVIPIPGNFKLSVNATLFRDLVGAPLDLKINIKKRTLGLYVPIPCLKGVGSCKYDLCSFLNRVFNSGCLKGLRDNNIPCKCQNSRPGTYTMKDEDVYIPKLSAFFKWLAKGDYKVDVKLYDRNLKQDVLCLRVQGSIRNPTCKGWRCRIFGGGR